MREAWCGEEAGLLLDLENRAEADLVGLQALEGHVGLLQRVDLDARLHLAGSDERQRLDEIALATRAGPDHATAQLHHLLPRIPGTAAGELEGSVEVADVDQRALGAQ